LNNICFLGNFNKNKDIKFQLSHEIFGCLNVFFDEYKNILFIKGNSTFQNIFLSNYKFLLSMIMKQYNNVNGISNILSNINKYSLKKIKFSYEVLIFLLTQAIFLLKKISFNDSEKTNNSKKSEKQIIETTSNKIKTDVTYSKIKINRVHKIYGNKILHYVCGIIILRCSLRF